MIKFSELPPNVKKAFRARQRLMLCADVLDIAIVENLPASRMAMGNIKQRINRIREDIDIVTKAFAKEILKDGEGAGGSKNFAFGFYTIINLLKDLDEDSLYELAEELKDKVNG